MDYLIWSVDVPEGHCVCSGMNGYEESYKVLYGQSVKSDFTGEVVFEMSPDFPKDIALADNIKNTGYLLVSKALKGKLQGAVDNRTEYLPVSIVNHKGRIASDEYYVVNPLDFCDAINMEASDVKWNRINPDVLSACYEMVLREEDIPPDFRLFRLKHFPAKVLVHREVAEALQAAGFSGLRFIEVEDYDGF